ncbi:MAG: hypothetical protein FJ318_02455 [SAR202 cluster bacterium]|nr:hypothetical protein [SAR202 cluster bacterium]
MLFHITHVHTIDQCPARNPELMRASYGEMIESAKGLGVRWVGIWVDSPAHTVFMVAEAETVYQLEKLLAPVTRIGHAEVKPVFSGLS